MSPQSYGATGAGPGPQRYMAHILSNSAVYLAAVAGLSTIITFSRFCRMPEIVQLREPLNTKRPSSTCGAGAPARGEQGGQRLHTLGAWDSSLHVAPLPCRNKVPSSPVGVAP